MKFRTTQKDVRNGYALRIRVGYCALQYLLDYESPVAYTSSRGYGWRADIYDMGCIDLPGVCIVTGYGPFGWAPPAGLIQEYDDKAKALLAKRHDVRLDNDAWQGFHRDRRDMLRDLLREFVDKCRDAYYGTAHYGPAE